MSKNTKQMEVPNAIPKTPGAYNKVTFHKERHLLAPSEPCGGCNFEGNNRKNFGFSHTITGVTRVVPHALDTGAKSTVTQIVEACQRKVQRKPTTYFRKEC
ncbi:Uncharacterized protein LW93_3323 [Fusarium fujikuroi]|nr:Uncharacterized protein LW93_3323 [Fusarium fujikuroi]